MEELDASSRGITSLSGIEHCTDLTSLDLNYNKISDISSVTNLINLNLNYNQLSDVSPLANLTNLTLWSNQLSDVSPLANLTKLKVLSVSNNQLTDWGGLANLTELNLNYNQLVDLNGLSNANFPELKDLSLVDNQLSDLNGLANVNLPKLTSLRLWRNLITDLSPLTNAYLSNPFWLELNYNQISDIFPLVENEGISGKIILKNNPLSNTSLTSHIPVLKAKGVKVEYDEVPADVIKMSDSAFEVFLRQAIGLPTGVVSKINTAGIVDLNMANAGVVNIDAEALKALPELKVINLADNPLSREAVLIQIPALETAGIKVNLGASEAHLVELLVDKLEIAASKVATKTIIIVIKDANDRLVKREVVTLIVDRGSIQEVADNQGDGTYAAVYTAIDAVGEAKVTAVAGNGVVGTIN